MAGVGVCRSESGASRHGCERPRASRGRADAQGLLDESWWREHGPGAAWQETMGADYSASDSRLRECTHAGRPFGDERFVRNLSERFDRHWARGRPKKQSVRAPGAENHAVQAELF